jgi:histone deacetylase 6
MRFHAEIVGYDEVDDDFHPEDPRRILEIFNELTEAGLVADYRNPTPEDAFKLWRIDARPVTPAEACLVHEPIYYEWVEDLAGS